MIKKIFKAALDIAGLSIIVAVLLGFAFINNIFVRHTIANLETFLACGFLSMFVFSTWAQVRNRPGSPEPWQIAFITLTIMAVFVAVDQFIFQIKA